MVIILLFTLIAIAVGEKHSRYFKYPDGLIPPKTFANQDFRMVNASTVTPDDLDVDLILNKYKFHPSYLGFIVKKNTNKVTHVLLKLVDEGFTAKLNAFINSPDDVFYEQRPTEGSYFLTRYFDFVEFKDSKRSGGCFLRQNMLSPSKTLKEHCESIPRCLGYVQNECLISSDNFDSPFVTSQNVYFEKKMTHDIFKWINDNTVSFSLILGASFVLISFYPKLIEKITKKRKTTTKVVGNDSF